MSDNVLKSYSIPNGPILVGREEQAGGRALRIKDVGQLVETAQGQFVAPLDPPTVSIRFPQNVLEQEANRFLQKLHEEGFERERLRKADIILADRIPDARKPAGPLGPDGKPRN